MLGSIFLYYDFKFCSEIFDGVVLSTELQELGTVTQGMLVENTELGFGGVGAWQG